MFEGIDHINIVARSIADLKGFYREVLGFVVLSEFDIAEPSLSTGLGLPDSALRVIFWAVPGTSTQIEMVQYLSGSDPAVQSPLANAPGFGHVALAVSDIHGVHRTLKARGAPFVSEPVLVAGETWFCFLRDPEGNILELIERGRDGASPE